MVNPNPPNCCFVAAHRGTDSSRATQEKLKMLNNAVEMATLGSANREQMALMDISVSCVKRGNGEKTSLIKGEQMVDHPTIRLQQEQKSHLVGCSRLSRRIFRR